jgi:hypothetical protein
MFTFNISIFLFTVLIILTAVYFKIYRTAMVVGVIYLLFAVIIFISTESEPKPEPIEALEVFKKTDSIMEDVDTIFAISDTIFDSAPFISEDSADIHIEQEIKNDLEVRSIKICRGIIVEQRKPIDVDTVFTMNKMDTLFCFTGIRNTDSDIQTITHIWEQNGKVKAKIAMEVFPSPFWRCWSRKRINKNQKGMWKVKIVDAEGNSIGEKSFSVN